LELRRPPALAGCLGGTGARGRGVSGSGEQITPPICRLCDTPVWRRPVTGRLHGRGGDCIPDIPEIVLHSTSLLFRPVRRALAALALAALVTGAAQAQAPATAPAGAPIRIALIEALSGP